MRRRRCGRGGCAGAWHVVPSSPLEHAASQGTSPTGCPRAANSHNIHGHGNPTPARLHVLSPEKNRLLTQVGPGTPMGELLRRYWMPIGGASQLEKEPIKAIRLMGEDLVLYKDLGGRYGLLDRHCPHRRADLSYGFVEETRS